MSMTHRTRRTAVRQHCRCRRRIAELVMTVHEDGPPTARSTCGRRPLSNALSELQAAAVEAGAEIGAIADVRGLPAALPAGRRGDLGLRAALLARSACVRRGIPAAAAARGRGVEWRTWQGSVEQSQLRCEEPLRGRWSRCRLAGARSASCSALYLPRRCRAVMPN